MIRQVHSFIWRIGHGEKLYGVIEEIISKQPFVDSSLKICLGEIHVITLGMAYYKFENIIRWRFLEEFVTTINLNHFAVIVNIFCIWKKSTKLGLLENFRHSLVMASITIV
jgi:hypothetical protein